MDVRNKNKDVYLSGQKGLTVTQLVYAFLGSNPRASNKAITKFQKRREKTDVGDMEITEEEKTEHVNELSNRLYKSLDGQPIDVAVSALIMVAVDAIKRCNIEKSVILEYVTKVWDHAEIQKSA